MDLTELQIDCHYLAKEKGFWPEGEQRNVPEMLALIHSEISEALEGTSEGCRSHGCLLPGHGREAGGVRGRAGRRGYPYPGPGRRVGDQPR
jgi:hypothetical protein